MQSWPRSNKRQKHKECGDGEGVLDRACRCEKRRGLQAIRHGQPGDIQEIRSTLHRAWRQVRVRRRRWGFPQRGYRSSRLCDRVSLLQFARISGEHEVAPATFHCRYCGYRGLRRTPALMHRSLIFSENRLPLFGIMLQSPFFSPRAIPTPRSGSLLMAEMRLVVAGAGGRMGRTLVKAIADSKEFVLAGALEDAQSPFVVSGARVLAPLP